MNKGKINYKSSGVNIDEGQKFIEDIKSLTKKRDLKNALSTIGSFSGYVKPPKKYKDPVFALACDGVGTKITLALKQKNLSSIGIYLVAMCVHDLVVSGATPLTFLDYYGVSKLNRNKGKEIIRGILKGCDQAGCELIGGETAEMPNHYTKDNFDLVGFAMGINERKNIIDD